MLKILLITQEENVYLPQSFGTVCRELGSEIAAIVSAPAMSTHGGRWKGIRKHLQVFRLSGTLGMASRIFFAKMRNLTARPNKQGPWYSIRHVAASFDIPYMKIPRINSPDFHKILDALTPDLLISISCPQIIPKSVRDRFPAGCINVHGAPLPKYRGLMPAFWMLLNNESEGAATVHILDEKLDDGDILRQVPVPITKNDTWESLVLKTKSAGARALIDVVHAIKQGELHRLPNRKEEATYFSFPTDRDAKQFYRNGRRFF